MAHTKIELLDQVYPCYADQQVAAFIHFCLQKLQQKDSRINDQILMMLFFFTGVTVQPYQWLDPGFMFHMLWLWHNSTLRTHNPETKQQLAMGIPGRSLVSSPSLSCSVFSLSLSFAAWGDLVYFYWKIRHICLPRKLVGGLRIIVATWLGG